MAFGRRKKYSRFRYRSIEDAAEANSVALGTSSGGGGGSDSVVTVVATANDLPGFDEMEAGTFAYSNTNTTLYYTNGTGWFKVTTVNETPSVTLSVTSVSLGAKSNTAFITFTVAEPEGAPWYATVSNSGIANTSLGNVVFYSANNTIEINNFANSENVWTGNVDIQVSDGINLAYARATIKVAYADGDPATFVPAVFAGEHTGADTWKRWLPETAPASPTWVQRGNYSHSSFAPGIALAQGWDISADGRFRVMVDNSGNDLQIFDTAAATNYGTAIGGVFPHSPSDSFKSHTITNANMKRDYDAHCPIYSANGHTITTFSYDEVTVIYCNTPFTTRDGYSANTYITYGTPTSEQDYWIPSSGGDTNTRPEQALGSHFFNNDGTKYYLVHNDFLNIWEYSLSSAWDVSTRDPVNVTKHTLPTFTSGTERGTNLRSVHVNIDGSVLFYHDIGTDSSYFYTMTPWDFSTLSFYYKISTSTYDAASQANWMSPYCDKFLLQNYNTADDVTDLSQNFDHAQLPHAVGGIIPTTTGSETGKVKVNYVTEFRGISFNKAGNNCIICNTSNDIPCQVSLTVPFDLRYPNNDLLYAPTDSATWNLYEATFGGPNDEYLYFTENNSDAIKRIDLPSGYYGDLRGVTTWDPDNASWYDQIWDPGSVTIYDFAFNNDGTKLIAALGGSGVAQVTLPTAWDLDSITDTAFNFTPFNNIINSQDTLNKGYPKVSGIHGLAFNNDGTIMVAKSSVRCLYWFDLSTPFDITTASAKPNIPSHQKWPGATSTGACAWVNDKYLYMTHNNGTIKMLEHTADLHEDKYYVGAVG